MNLWKRKIKTKLVILERMKTAFPDIEIKKNPE